MKSMNKEWERRRNRWKAFKEQTNLDKTYKVDAFNKGYADGFSGRVESYDKREGKVDYKAGYLRGKQDRLAERI